MRSPWDFCRAIVVIFALHVLAGCTTDPAAERTTAVDPLSKQARKLRSNSTEEQGTGLDDRSRAIERDLGYR